MRDDGENNGVQEGDRNEGSGLDDRMHTMRPLLRRLSRSKSPTLDYSSSLKHPKYDENPLGGSCCLRTISTVIISDSNCSDLCDVTNCMPVGLQQLRRKQTVHCSMLKLLPCAEAATLHYSSSLKHPKYDEILWEGPACVLFTVIISDSNCSDLCDATNCMPVGLQQLRKQTVHSSILKLLVPCEAATLHPQKL
jgi:hypothetical protein